MNSFVTRGEEHSKTLYVEVSDIILRIGGNMTDLMRKCHHLRRLLTLRGARL